MSILPNKIKITKTSTYAVHSMWLPQQSMLRRLVKPPINCSLLNSRRLDQSVIKSLQNQQKNKSGSAAEESQLQQTNKTTKICCKKYTISQKNRQPKPMTVTLSIFDLPNSFNTGNLYKFPAKFHIINPTTPSACCYITNLRKLKVDICHKLHCFPINQAATKLVVLIPSRLNQFSKLFHCWTDNQISNTHHTFSMLPHQLMEF